ncbi:hypothetical protein [Polaromonas hydrogenivorans]|uniref:Enoyl-CoA hydratase n=1 Tax=Polaromonas hydrogenivorans TaxID=335476 RepID=A0AAU7M015_9BURK
MNTTETTSTNPATDELLVDRKGEVVRLTINRPHRRNALTEGVLIVAFLASDLASYVNRCCVPVDGEFSIN